MHQERRSRSLELRNRVGGRDDGSAFVQIHVRSHGFLNRTARKLRQSNSDHRSRRVQTADAHVRKRVPDRRSLELRQRHAHKGVPVLVFVFARALTLTRRRRRRRESGFNIQICFAGTILQNRRALHARLIAHSESSVADVLKGLFILFRSKGRGRGSKSVGGVCEGPLRDASQIDLVQRLTVLVKRRVPFLDASRTRRRRTDGRGEAAARGFRAVFCGPTHASYGVRVFALVVFKEDRLRDSSEKSKRGEARGRLVCAIERTSSSSS